MITERPEIFWGTVASMYVGNVMLLILNLPLIGIWVKLLTVPYKYLVVVIVVICIIGAYSVNYTSFDVGAMMVFGVFGYLIRKLRFPAGPLVLAMILGPMLERYHHASAPCLSGTTTAGATRLFHGGNPFACHFFARLDDLADGVAVSIAEVVETLFARLEANDVGLSQVNDVNVIANTGAVGGRVIRAVNFALRFLAEGDFEDIRNEMSLDPMMFAEAFARAGGVK
jgi:hypothetical protein